MEWIAPTEKNSNAASLEKSLWDAADQFRANSGLKAQQYSGPILGLIFLRFADVRFAKRRGKLEKDGSTSRRGSRVDQPEAYHAAGVLYLPEAARFDFLLNLPEAEKIGDKVNTAMRAIEESNPQLAGVLPKTYNLFDLPRTDNANYLWIQLFHSALNTQGRAGFVMANSASDARASEQELRKHLIESKAVDVMVAVGPNMFYTVTLPCTLWFLDRGKVGTDREDKVLFIDARHIYRQIDRAHREWTEAQISFIANIVRLYRGEEPDFTLGGDEAREKIEEVFETNGYGDIPGLCKAATLEEIEAQGWSLNPGRYIGIAPGEEISGEDFMEQFEELNEELENLNAQARDLESTIAQNATEILDA